MLASVLSSAIVALSLFTRFAYCQFDKNGVVNVKEDQYCNSTSLKPTLAKDDLKQYTCFIPGTSLLAINITYTLPPSIIPLSLPPILTTLNSLSSQLKTAESQEKASQKEYPYRPLLTANTTTTPKSKGKPQQLTTTTRFQPFPCYGTIYEGTPDNPTSNINLPQFGSLQSYIVGLHQFVESTLPENAEAMYGEFFYVERGIELAPDPSTLNPDGTGGVVPPRIVTWDGEAAFDVRFGNKEPAEQPVGDRLGRMMFDCSLG